MIAICQLCCTSLVLSLVCLAAASEWSGGEGWALFDVPERRAMWVWSLGDDGIGANTGTQKWDGADSWARGFENHRGARDLFLDFCQNKSIRVVHLFNVTWEWDREIIESGHLPHEAAFAETVAAAHERGIQVWLMGYLWDATNAKQMREEEHKQAIRKIMMAVQRFNRAHPEAPLAGYHNDEEPQNPTLYPAMLDTLKIGQDWVDEHAPELLISQAIAYFWRGRPFAWNGAEKTMNDHIIDLVGHTAYMAYSDNPQVALQRYALPAVERATAAGHRAAIGQEVEDVAWLFKNAARTTWWEEIRAEDPALRFKPGAGETPGFEDAMHAMTTRLRREPGFDRMVIHQYSAYFTHWFGMRPRAYCLSRPGGAYDPQTEQPPKVDLLDDIAPLYGLGPRREGP